MADHLSAEAGLCSSFGSTYSTATTEEQPFAISDQLVEGLRESAPLLFKGTAFIESPSPIQSWRAVVAELLGPQRLWMVLVSAIIASLCAILSGYTLGYPSLVISSLGSSFNNTLMKDLFGAFAPLGAVSGGVVAGWSSEVLGRKPTLLLCSVPSIIGWLMLASTEWFNLSDTLLQLMVLGGRLVTGFSMGWAMLSSPMYIAEISPPLLRGLFSSMPQFALALGILLVYCVETVIITYTSLVAAAITAVFAMASLWLIETPRYLVKHGDIGEALKNLRLLRGPQVDVQIELEDIKNIIHQESSLSLREFVRELRNRSIYIPLILLTVVLSFQQLSGINPIIYYAAPILKQAHVSNTTFTALLAIGVTEVVTTFLTIFIIDLFGRKLLLLVSCVVLCLSCVGLGTHLYYGTNPCTGICHSTLPLAVVSIIMVIIGFSLGLGPIPWALVTELVPLRARGIIGGMASAVTWTFAALVTGTYNQFTDGAGEYSAWWTFGACNMCVAVFVAFFLPETKGKKLEVIEKQIHTKYRLCYWK